MRWQCPETAETAATFGALVKLVRQGQGVSQPELARRLGVTQPVVSKLERGGSTPQQATVQRVAEALGVSIVMSAVQEAS